MSNRHDIIEQNTGLLIALIILVVAVGGLVEIVPLYFQRSTTAPVAGLKPLPALQLAGRDVYIREGCNNCHSQMIRPFRAETERYGHYSVAGEFVYDHPFLWGSKRTGPDLQRVGGKYPDLWHYKHLIDPRSTSQASIMPPYAFLSERRFDAQKMPAVMRVMRRLGVPYSEDEIQAAPKAAAAQAQAIAAGLEQAGEKVAADSEIIALIAYLQRLGIENKK